MLKRYSTTQHFIVDRQPHTIMKIINNTSLVETIGTSLRISDESIKGTENFTHTHSMDISLLSSNIMVLLIVSVSGIATNACALSKITKSLWKSYPLITQMTVLGLIISAFYVPVSIIRLVLQVQNQNGLYAFYIIEMCLWHICEIMSYTTLAGIAIQRARTVKATFSTPPSKTFEHCTIIMSWVCGGAVFMQQVISYQMSGMLTCSLVFPTLMLLSCSLCLLIMSAAYCSSVMFLRQDAQNRNRREAIQMKMIRKATMDPLWLFRGN